MIIHFKRFFIKPRKITVFWEKAGRLKDNSILADMNVRKKAGDQLFSLVKETRQEELA
jgi:hypothetical protein